MIGQLTSHLKSLSPIVVNLLHELLCNEFLIKMYRPLQKLHLRNLFPSKIMNIC